MSNQTPKDILEEFDIEVADEKLNLLTKEMVNDIIDLAIQKSEPKPNDIKHNENSFVLDFSQEKDRPIFEESFRKNMFSVVNEYLKSKDLVPKEYHRVISIEIGGGGLQTTMRF